MAWVGGVTGGVLLLVASAVLAEEGGAPQAPPVAMPDVRANVMRMLEESRNREEVEAVVEATPPASDEHHVEHVAPAAAPLAETPVPPPAAPHTPEAVIPPASTKVVVSPPPAAAPPRRDNHVPLEQKEITIQSLDDIRKLSAELKEAKRRHAAQRSTD